MARGNFPLKSDSLDRFEQVERSKIKSKGVEFLVFSIIKSWVGNLKKYKRACLFIRNLRVINFLRILLTSGPLNPWISWHCWSQLVSFVLFVLVLLSHYLVSGHIEKPKRGLDLGYEKLFSNFTCIFFPIWIFNCSN